MEVESLPVLVSRKFRSSDLPYVVSSWLHSMRPSMVEESEGAPKLPHEVRVRKFIYDRGQRRRIGRLLDDPKTRLLCSVAVEDMDTIVGWAAARGDCLHYVFVRPAFRRNGISRDLLRSLFPAGMRRYSTRTAKGDSFVASRHPDAVFDPFAIDGEDGE